MASLKEIKIRIASISSTQKITSAMKMVSSAKLHHAQAAVEHILVYEKRLSAILGSILSSECETDLSYTTKREVKRVAIVAFSSNTGLCGAFNTNIWRELSARISRYEAEHIPVVLYPVGKKVANELRKAGYETDNRFILIGDKPTYEEASGLATYLMKLFTDKTTDHVELLYHHYKNKATQEIIRKTFLPVDFTEQEVPEASTDYILEPSPEMLLELLLPKVLNLQIYTTLLDNSAAEHAARMLAMQTANDNASDLIRDLTLQYNKTRQQTITNELLDIMGGAG